MADPFQYSQTTHTPDTISTLSRFPTSGPGSSLNFANVGDQLSALIMRAIADKKRQQQFENNLQMMDRKVMLDRYRQQRMDMAGAQADALYQQSHFGKTMGGEMPAGTSYAYNAGGVSDPNAAAKSQERQAQIAADALKAQTAAAEGQALDDKRKAEYERMLRESNERNAAAIAAEQAAALGAAPPPPPPPPAPTVGS